MTATRSRPRRASTRMASSTRATARKTFRARSPHCSWLITASTTPGIRSTGPWASVPDFTARTAATVPTRRSDAAAGEAKDTRPVSESQRNTAPAMRSAIAKWTTLGWRPARLGIVRVYVPVSAPVSVRRDDLALDQAHARQTQLLARALQGEPHLRVLEGVVVHPAPVALDGVRRLAPEVLDLLHGERGQDGCRDVVVDLAQLGAHVLPVGPRCHGQEVLHLADLAQRW